jgi:redox-sensing transcriptional repressor
MDKNYGMKLPAKTVDRISQYRRVLQRYEDMDEPYIFSHALAKLLHLTAVQVRHDLMLINSSGNYRHGYNVKELLTKINNTLSTPKAQKATIIGMGELGKALLKQISTNPACPANIIATFDFSAERTNKSYHKIPCYDFTRSAELISMHNIKIAILAIASTDIQEIVDSLIISGITCVVNYSGGPFRVPDEIILKDYDIRTTLDELSYFISQKQS